MATRWMHRTRVLGLTAAAGVALGAVRDVAHAETEAPVLVMVLDASGSMRERIEGRPKIDTAREVVRSVVEGLPDSAEAGLLAYGHRDPEKCDDIELLVPLGALDKEGFEAKVNALHPRGKTPLTAATRQAIELAKAHKKPATVVLVSDGLETCGASPCDMIKEAKRAGVDFVLHVVGFDIASADSSALRCAAEAGGGRYFEARSAAELSAALSASVAAVQVATGTLTVKVSEAGQPMRAMVEVRKAGGRELVRMKASSGKDGVASFRLAPGSYDLSAKPIEKRGLAPAEARAIDVSAGGNVEHAFSFGAGSLQLTVTHNGKPLQSKPFVKLHREGDRRGVLTVAARKVATTRAKEGVFEFDLDPGSYELAVSTLEIAGEATQTVKLTIEAGKSVAQRIDFSSGRLSLVARKNGKPIGANALLRSDTAKPVQKMSVDARPEISVELPPGHYKARVFRPARGHSNIELDIKAGETTERVIDW